MIIYSRLNGKLKMNGNLIFLVPKICHEVKFRYFQYNINNNILVTYSFLANINKIESGERSYCKEQPEKK